MADDGEEHEVENIRKTLLGELIGQRLVDVTQHDKDEYAERGAFVTLMFENGGTLEFPVGQGEGQGFTVDLIE